MSKKRWFLPWVGSAVLALSVISPSLAGELCKAPEASALLAETATAPTWLAAGALCNAWIITNYYSNASHTTLVGQCQITCAQYDMELVFPTFNGGGTCHGTSSAFTSDLYGHCPCRV